MMTRVSHGPGASEETGVRRDEGPARVPRLLSIVDGMGKMGLIVSDGAAGEWAGLGPGPCGRAPIGPGTR